MSETKSTEGRTMENGQQHFDDARVRNIVNAITAAAWHHRDDQREMLRAVDAIATPFLKHPEASLGWMRVPIRRINNLLNLIDPAPAKGVDGQTYVFRNPMAAEMLTRISAEVRSMTDEMKGPQDDALRRIREKTPTDLPAGG